MGRKEVSLHTIGEPLINPYLEDYFKILKRYKIHAFLSTNGYILDKKIDLLCKYSDVINKLRFSIDGATKQTYERIRTPGRFDKLIDNLELFKKVNRNNTFKNVGINSVVSDEVKHELAYHLKFYSKYVRMDDINLCFINSVSPDTSYFFRHGLLKKHTVPTKPCFQIGNVSMTVLCDGKITICCRDYNGDLVFGNILENIPSELFNKELTKLLNSIVDDKIPKDHLCNSCFQIDPRVSKLFAYFVRISVIKNIYNWDIDKMQVKFDRFFELFDQAIPNEAEYISLFN